ncbi:MAG: MarR family transcriptional regulator [Candidatus Sphingomonas colombiensis]|nr:MarR family transcriptional regulator [Sphingomonas sp.]WEK42148.1 MAG: MarR family transcriptional regulator [Sphingomonas sp.]
MAKKMYPISFYAETTNSIGYLTRMAFRSFTRSLERRTQPYGVTAGQWRFLRALWAQDGVTQRELSRRVGINEPTVVTAINGMEKKGFVRREQSTTDRRRLHVFLTPKARELEEQLLPHVAEVNELATRNMTEEQVKMLRELLAMVTSNLAEDISE